jgi:hypothetical protein
MNKYDELLLTREDDFDSSIAAAKKIKRTISRTMRDVYHVLSQYPLGLTDSELRSAMVQHGFLPRAESSYRKRRTDLAQQDYVMWTGEHRANASGCLERVWATTNALPHVHTSIETE